jgi:Protein of unknown function (DUF2844)
VEGPNWAHTRAPWLVIFLASQKVCLKDQWFSPIFLVVDFLKKRGIMKQRSVLKFKTYPAFFLLFLACSYSWASLGQKANSIEADKQKLVVKKYSFSTHENYTIHEIVYGGITLRQYVAKSSGTVFGIAWNGYRHPDIAKFLGTYAEEYQAANQAQRRSRGARFRRVQSPHLIVEQSGQMHQLRGRAFDPNLIPPGVSRGEIQ